jgi:L-threonylcarbamoyladenylate synthase
MFLFKGNKIRKAVDVLNNGGIVAYPTDTLYGLGVDIFNKEAVNNLFLVKKRDYAKPLSVAVADFNDIYNLAEVDGNQKSILRKFLPGPYTFLLKNKHTCFDLITSSSDLIGLRYPNHSLTLELIKKFGRPITATSANISGEEPATSYKQINFKVDYIIKGRVKYGQHSTVVDLVNREIVREGAGFDEIKNFFN